MFVCLCVASRQADLELGALEAHGTSKNPRQSGSASWGVLRAHDSAGRPFYTRQHKLSQFEISRRSLRLLCVLKLKVREEVKKEAAATH